MLIDEIVRLTPCVSSRPTLRVALGGLGADRGMLWHIDSIQSIMPPEC